MLSQHSQFFESHCCELQQLWRVAWQHGADHRLHTHDHEFEDTKSCSEGTLIRFRGKGGKRREENGSGDESVTSCVLC